MARLVVGLGNPGEKYRMTRHNLGLMVVETFAERLGATLKREFRMKGKLAHPVWNGEKIHLLFPTTFMNLSGRSVVKVASYYKVAVEEILIVTDEVHLPFGETRVREKGSCAGHNGLRSVENCLGTQEYARLRMGVGPKLHPDQALDEFVLGNFTREECEKLAPFIDEGVKEIETWLQR